MQGKGMEREQMMTMMMMTTQMTVVMMERMMGRTRVRVTQELQGHCWTSPQQLLQVMFHGTHPCLRVNSQQMQ
jgi:predicted transcriptional regulator